MGNNSVGKQSCRDVGQLAWKIIQYLLLLPYYSIGISLRPVWSQPQISAKTVHVGIVTNLGKSTPLIYKIVQTDPSQTDPILTDPAQPTPIPAIPRTVDPAPPNLPEPSINKLGTPTGSIELNADQQEFNNQTQIVTADGKVVVRFNKAILNADRLNVNLKTKLATAEGNVVLIRGKQILYGDRFEYNFDQDRGSIMEARGDIYQPTLIKDLNIIPKANTPVLAGEKKFTEPLLSDRLRIDQPVSKIQNTGSSGIILGSDRPIDYQPVIKSSGTLNRLRFQANKVDFAGDKVTAEQIRITNDPFSPPELQIKAERAQFKTVNSEEDEVTIGNGRITIENNFDVPFVKDRFVLNKNGKDSNLFSLGIPFNIGIDADERGGIFLESNFYPVFDPRFKVTFTPQYFIQRAVTNLTFLDSSVFGIKANVEGDLTPDTRIQASASLASLNLSRFSSNLRAKASVKKDVSLLSLPHILTGEAVYRERIFNGSLGYQEVESSLGGLLTSPNIPIGNTGINLDYQVGAQIVTANTDRQNLLQPIRSNDLVSLNRYQTAANLTKSFRLWEGKGLPADRPETYNYSPVPVVPYLQLNTGIKGAISSYSNGEDQSSVGYNVGVQGQIGNFSGASFDYTGFNLNYFQQFRGNSSPFLFDRVVDNRLLSAGINQQISGPWRLGIQASVNLDTGQAVSTDYYVEYSRRTYNFLIRYNPTLQLGSIGFRLNDFNWDGLTPKF
jgi:lipopolysaccharide export system protein LptA